MKLRLFLFGLFAFTVLLLASGYYLLQVPVASTTPGATEVAALKEKPVSTAPALEVTPIKHSSEEDSTAKPPLEDADFDSYLNIPDPDVEIVVEENRRLAEANRRLNTQLVDTFNWIIHNLKGKKPVEAGVLTHLRMPSIGEDYLLHPDIASYLHVTTREQEIINGALLATRDNMNWLEDQILTMSNDDPQRVVLTIPPYPEEGSIIRQELYNALEYALGEHRFGSMLDISSADLDSQFHLFGNASRMIVFEHGWDPDDNLPRLVIRDAWIMYDEQNRRHVQETKEAVAEVPLAYEDYVSRLPGAFWDRAVVP